MKKYLIIAILSISITSICCSKKSEFAKNYKLQSDFEIEQAKQKNDKYKMITGYNNIGINKEKTYEIRLYDNNEAVIQEFKNDLRHGKTISLYSNGKYGVIEEYKYGKPNGWYIGYYDNGNKNYQFVNKNGKKDINIPQTVWYYDGTVFFSEKIFEDTTLRTYWNKDKNQIAKLVLKDDKPFEGKLLNFLSTKWYDTVILEEEFKGGKKNGKYIKRTCGNAPPAKRKFYIYEEGEYKDNLLNGKVKIYDNNSKLIKESEYIVGKLINEKKVD